MYDHELRTEIARDRFNRLRLDWGEPRPEGGHPARRVLASLLIRAGERLAPEPCAHPRRELSSRA